MPSKKRRGLEDEYKDELYERRSSAEHQGEYGPGLYSDLTEDDYYDVEFGEEPDDVPPPDEEYFRPGHSEADRREWDISADHRFGELKPRRCRPTRRSVVGAWSFLFAVALFSSIFVFGASAARARLQSRIDVGYMRALSGLCEYLSGINTQLGRAAYVSEAPQMSAVAVALSRQVGGAKENLSQLPLNNADIGTLQKFLSQSGDYISSLSAKLASGGQITDTERAALRALQSYSDKLSQSLSNTEAGMYNYGGSDAIYYALSGGVLDHTAGIDQFSAAVGSMLGGPLADYPGFIAGNAEPGAYAMLDGADEVSLQQAEDAAAHFLGVPPAMLQFAGNGGGSPPTYSFISERGFIQVTLRGGYVITYTADRAETGKSLPEQQLLEKAQAALTEHGYSDMQMTYYRIEQGELTADFVYRDGDVTCYTDLVKVGVQTDTGECSMFDASGYLRRHHARAAAAGLIAQDDAAGKVGPGLQIISARLAVIPSPDGEALCYEFKCSNAQGAVYLDYIDARTGAERGLLAVVDTGSGKMAA